MDEMKYICLYKSYLELLSPYTDKEVGRLTIAMLRYAVLGELPDFPGNEKFIWPSLQMRMDMDAQNYGERRDACRKNGARGGRPKLEGQEQPKVQRLYL